MCLIATAPVTPHPPPITNDGWFPDIDLKRVRAAMRLDGTVTETRLTEAVIAAMARVNAELATWQMAQRLAGWTNLAAVPAPHLNGESVQLMRYRRAVHHRAKADLTARYRDFDTTTSGAQHAQALEDTIAEDRREARWAIRDLLGMPQTTVALI